MLCTIDVKARQVMASPNADGDTWTGPLTTCTTAETTDTEQKDELKITSERNSPPTPDSGPMDIRLSQPQLDTTSSVAKETVLVTEPVLSLRLLMNSKEVGSIIGKGGTTIKAFREQSGAKINISNGLSSERLVTVTGTRESICSAVSAIATKMHQDSTVPSKPPGIEAAVSLRIIIQTSQCGSLIGKGGARIRDIREQTGTSMQVAGDTLPNSTERVVTISGSPSAVTLCINEICTVILENPPKGPFVAYKPHALPNQAYQPRPNMTFQSPYSATFNTAAQPATTVQHMRIPNDLIGCVIGRKGTKIHEIRVNSGAMIKIAGNEGDGADRLVTITGTPESVGLAQYLINSRIHLEVNSFLSVGMNTV